ncbi:glutathione S-transferase family protein [Sphingomonas sp. MMS24-JH45]
MTRPVITAFDWVPGFARGQVRDLRVRWALEEVGQPYDVLYLSQGEQKAEPHRGRQPFGQVPTYEEGDLVLFEIGRDRASRRGRPRRIAAGDARRPGAGDRVDVCRAQHARAADHGPQHRDAVRARRALVRCAPSCHRGAHPQTARRGVARLGRRDWLDGGEVAGDLMMVAVLRIVAGDGFLDRYDNLAAYVARGEARPAFRKALADQMAGFTGSPPPGFADWLKAQGIDSEGEAA